MKGVNMTNLRKIRIYEPWPGIKPLRRNFLRMICFFAGFEPCFLWSECTKLYLLIDQDKIESILLFEKKVDLLTLFMEKEGEIADREKIGIYTLYCMLRKKNGEGTTMEETAFFCRLDELKSFINGSECSLPKDEFWNDWKRVISPLRDIKLRERGEINLINKSEIKTYKEIFSQSGEIVPSIDHSTCTLLSILPGNAERILDVGAGPGYVNRNIPEDYAVLAMDIDSEILKENRWPTCVGDVLDIPLEDKAVDLSMACDVLEHIEPTDLPRAISELERVSSKYLYIQVPYKEELDDSYARCDVCGNIWHVNFHKTSFTLENLLKLPGDKWEAITIGFTGDVSYRKNGTAESELLRQLKVKTYQVVNWRCPKCGGISEPYQHNYYTTAHDICASVETDEDQVLPRYSEIAVLFCRKEYLPPKRASKKNHVQLEIDTYTSELIFNDATVFSDVYTGNELIPIAFYSNCKYEEKEFCFMRTNEEAPWIAAAFPHVFKEGDTIRFKGYSAKGDNLTVCLLNINKQEYVSETINVEPGEFERLLKVNYHSKATRGFVKLYFTGEHISIYSITLSKNQGHAYKIVKMANGSNHYILLDKDKEYRWYIGEPTGTWFRPDFRQWLDQSEKGVGKVKGEQVLHYIEDLREIIFKQAEDNNSLAQKVNDSSAKDIQCYLERIRTLELQLTEKEMIVGLTESVNNKLDDELKQKIMQIDILNQTCAAKQREIAELQDRLLIMEALSQNIKREKIKGYIIPFCRKFCHGCIKIIHRIPYLYPLLVRLGIKNLYNKIKLIIKGGQSYE